MLKGGYQILNFDGLEFTPDVGIVSKGIYKKIKNTTKAILISGLLIEGVLLRDTYVDVKSVGDNFEFIINDYKVTIQNNDVINITKNEPSTTQGNVITVHGDLSDLASETTFDITPHNPTVDINTILQFNYGDIVRVAAIYLGYPQIFRDYGIEGPSSMFGFEIRGEDKNQIFFFE